MTNPSGASNACRVAFLSARAGGGGGRRRELQLRGHSDVSQVPLQEGSPAHQWEPHHRVRVLLRRQRLRDGPQRRWGLSSGGGIRVAVDHGFEK